MSNECVNRLELVRQYLLDVFHNPNSILEASDAVNYVKFNFHEAVKAARAAEDIRRAVRRIGVGAKTLASLQTFNLESDMVELRIGRMWPVISSEQTFSLWFSKNLLSPVIAEESRILGHSLANIVHTGSGVGSYFDRTAEIFRFKIWEVVHFPDAKDVPPRVLQSPDETNPPPRRME
jgi:hypothetical protein